MASSKKMIKYQNQVLVLGNELMEFATELDESRPNKRTTAVETIYNLASEIQGTIDMSSTAKNIEKDLKVLPIVFHIQLLRIFIERFYSEIVLDKSLIEMNHKTLDLVDILDEVTNKFYEDTSRIPSPIEVIYLTVNGFLEQKQLSTDMHEKARDLVGDNKIQKRVLSDFLTKYSQKYEETLKKGVITNA